MNLTNVINFSASNVTGMFHEVGQSCYVHAQEMYGAIYDNMYTGKLYYYTLAFLVIAVLYHLVRAYESWKGENGITIWFKDVFSWYFLLIAVVHMQFIYW